MGEGQDFGAGSDPAGGDRDGTLLIYAPVPLHQDEAGLYQEDQACNGLRLWAQNFDRVLVMMPLAPRPPPPNWIPISSLGHTLDRVEVHPLPLAYRPDTFVRRFRETRVRIRQLIARADYLSFSIGGLAGDWGSVACLTAHGMGRDFAVWTDRVEHRVVRQTASGRPLSGRLRAAISAPIMAQYEKFVIRRAAVGLFHGAETYEHYAPYSAEPHIVHDIHLKPEDHIPEDRLAAKIAGVQAGPVKIAYVGRAHAMKGPMDWVETLGRLSACGVGYEATWLGDGPELDAMRRRVDELGIGDRVRCVGHVASRQAVLDILRDSHLFLFCHRTPESPRCLIEALCSAVPLCGYSSAFAEDLVSDHGGGRFVDIGDTASLADLVADLAGDRARLGDLIARAARDGHPFTDEHVFRHRSDIIRGSLGPRVPSRAAQPVPARPAEWAG